MLAGPLKLCEDTGVTFDQWSYMTLFVHDPTTF